MRVAPTVNLSAEERSQLEEWAHSHSLSHQLVLRSKSVLLADEGFQNKRTLEASRSDTPSHGWRTRSKSVRRK